jgi:hypothetical protein
MLATWDDHLRQHEPVTVADRTRQHRVRDLTDPERAPVVTHLIAARTTVVRHTPSPVA